VTTKRKKPRGRPGQPLPPRIDATAEEIAEVVLRAKPTKPFYAPPDRPEYHCEACGKVVSYPDTLYRDNRCEGCHKVAHHDI
jgi:hypothetical protein